MSNNNKRKYFASGVLRISLIGIFAALAYIGFMFLRIDIPVGGDKTAFHPGNAFLIIAALFLGPLDGALAGSIGMTIADLTAPQYAIYAPTTFFLKFSIGLITGFVAHSIGHLYQIEDRKKASFWTFVASLAGMLFNILADPLVGFFYKKYILKIGADAASIWAKMSAITTSVNAILAIILAVLVYQAIMPLRRKLIQS